MKNFEFERWDGGRLIVNTAFASVLRHNGMTNFDAVMHHQGETVAKNLLRERVTTRFTLVDVHGDRAAFYIKRHAPPPWKEYVKPLFRLTRPLLGARHEWNAILNFHAARIPTMTPVALGESRGHSFLITQAIEGCTKLSHWMQHRIDSAAGSIGSDSHRKSGHGHAVTKTTREIIRTLARIARMMHGSGLHHQDFYLTHFLMSDAELAKGLFVIDLGRVRQRRLLSKRWIVKDLAQLNYSSPHSTKADRLRFLETYLGRPLERSDRPLLWQIERKTRAIRRHSKRHGL